MAMRWAEVRTSEQSFGIDGITHDELSEVRSLKHPPSVVRRTLEATCLILDLGRPKPTISVQIKPPTWPKVQRELADLTFLTRALTYDTGLLQSAPALVAFLLAEYFNDEPPGGGEKPTSRASSCSRVLATRLLGRARTLTEPMPEQLTFHRVSRANHAVAVLFKWCHSVLLDIGAIKAGEEAGSSSPTPSPRRRFSSEQLVAQAARRKAHSSTAPTSLAATCPAAAMRSAIKTAVPARTCMAETLRLPGQVSTPRAAGSAKATPQQSITFSDIVEPWSLKASEPSRLPTSLDYESPVSATLLSADPAPPSPPPAGAAAAGPTRHPEQPAAQRTDRPADRQVSSQGRQVAQGEAINALREAAQAQAHAGKATAAESLPAEEAAAAEAPEARAEEPEVCIQCHYESLITFPLGSDRVEWQQEVVIESVQGFLTMRGRAKMQLLGLPVVGEDREVAAKRLRTVQELFRYQGFPPSATLFEIPKGSGRWHPMESIAAGVLCQVILDDDEELLGHLEERSKLPPDTEVPCTPQVREAADWLRDFFRKGKRGFGREGPSKDN